ncbi:heavy-metal-associated domain-containing protein [Mucilaginibacter sp.]
MTHTYQITGMTCGGCLAKVQKLLTAIPDIQKADISLAEGTADITMLKHIPTTDLQKALADYPKYQLSETHNHTVAMALNDDTEQKTWIQTYKPILLIGAYLLSIAFIAGKSSDGFSIQTTMRVFMGGFFLVFSFFKLLDVQGFADSYAMYDLIAKRIKAWGYVYVFIELSLGILYATNILPKLTNGITLIVMSISLIGVVQSVLNKRQIRCACLGSVFNLPMSTLTIIEDALMIGMSLLILLL